MTSAELSVAERLKFEVLAAGIAVPESTRTALSDLVDSTTGTLTSADYASTSGVILRLDDDVWVNAPIVDHNANFVDEPAAELVLSEDGLRLRTPRAEVDAAVWIQPRYHGGVNGFGEELNSYVYSHADRARVAPIEGCAMACRFCDLPYQYRYRTKDIDRMVAAVGEAITDVAQPASHLLVSGGTPRVEDFSYLTDAYDALLESIVALPIDIMMVPYEAVLDFDRLNRAGVNELSINIELYGAEAGRRLMRRKHDQGLEHYLGFLGKAAEAFAPGRVRSMVLVGLEPMEDTLAGVKAIAERGCTPVLSPFRPDPRTPLRDVAAPTTEFMIETYLRSLNITRSLGGRLGPRCLPCSHNTLTLSANGLGDADMAYGRPRLISP